MKAALIVDMPDNCYECDFSRNMNCVILCEEVNTYGIHENCPFKHIREYNPDYNPYFDEAEKAYKDGYEQCLKDILK